MIINERANLKHVSQHREFYISNHFIYRFDEVEFMTANKTLLGTFIGKLIKIRIIYILSDLELKK